MIRNTILSLVALLVLTASAFAQQPRPQQGQYFNFVAPAGFQLMQESTNAAIFGSTQNGGAMYGLMGWIGMNGQNTDAYATLFGQAMQLQNVRILGVQPVQPVQGFQQAAMYEFTYSAQGQNYRGAALVNMAAGTGAVHFVASRPETFEQMKPMLLSAAMSVSANSANTFGAVAHFKATRPMGDYGIGNWKPYDASKTNERVARHMSEQIREEQHIHDPRTGETHQVGYNMYDPENGGYVNPNNPYEILPNGPAWDPEPRR
jgi:hypothetical protein